MKTTIMRTTGIIFSAGVLLTSCVSSKKYHRSQDEVAKLKSDSTTLAQQASTLQQNLTTSQQQNTDLQKSVQDYTSSNAGLQKNIAYYSTYATKDQANTKQIKDELNTSLAASGLTDQDIILRDGKIYVNIGEKSLFKGSSAVLTSKGKDLVNNLGQFVKSHDAIDVSVADLEQANSVAESNGADNNNGVTGSGSTSTASATTPGKAQTNQSGTTAMNGTNTNATNNNADYTTRNRVKTDNTSMATDKTAHKAVAVHHAKKAHTATSGESKSVAYASGRHNNYTAERSKRSTARAIAWKRQNAVADALLMNGIPKVKVVAQNQSAANNTGAQKGVQVVLVHDMDNFYKHMSETPAVGQPVSKNP